MIRLSTVLRAAVLALMLSSSGFAQGDRVNLLSARDDYGSYNDIWGYSDGGREIAILGVTNGVAFYDCTVPTAPIFLTFISHPSSTWGDIATYGSYAYVVNENGGGMQIIDMGNLNNIQLAATYNGFSSAHNVAIDEVAGFCLAPGTNVGMQILSLANPVSPSLITTYNGAYVHDASVQNGMAHCGEIYDGNYRILDLGNLPSLSTLDFIRTPGAFTHTAYPNSDDSICVTTDESSGGFLTIYDISNPSNIVERSRFVGGSLIHNAFVHGDTAHCSYYAEGYVAVDISDPANPVKKGSYDTYGGSSGSYDGAWGVYPYSPSGVVYVSDIYTGLYVLALALDVNSTPLPDTLDSVGPYTAVATMSSSAVNTATLHFTVDDGANWTQVAMNPTGNPDEWAADIPGQSSGTTVQYYLEGSDGSSTGRFPAVEGDLSVFSVGPRTSLLANGFEGAGDDGWTHGQIATQDDWQRGTPAGKAGDPGTAFEGWNCWANDLGGSGFNGFYADDVNNWLQSPDIDCSNATGTRLRFERWLTVEDAANDQARIRVNGNTVWENPTGFDLADTGWVTFDLDISAWADGVSDTKVRFVMRSDSATNFGGWNIDNFEVYSVEGCPPPFHYGNGFPGTGGVVPTIDATGGAPSIGNSAFTIEGHDMLGGASAFLLVGFDQAALPFADITIWVDLNLFLQFRRKADGPDGVAGEGDILFNAGIPNDPSAVGVELALQWLVLDAGAPRRWAATDGLSFEICD